MKVVLAAAGTRGDVQPLLALAQGLHRRGHTSVVAASPSFSHDCERLGVPFVPMGRDVDAWLRSEGGQLPATPRSLFKLLNRAIRSELEAQFEVLPALAREADLLLGAGALVAGASAAAAVNRPYRYVAYTNQSIPSDEHMPTILPFQGAPRWLNRLAWRACSWFYDRLLLEPLNRRRAALGLGAARRVVDVFLPAGGLVLAADQELSPPPSGAALTCTGAWQLDDPRPLPEALERFLEAGPKPIFAAFGSMPDPTPEKTAALLLGVARDAGRRLVVTGSGQALIADAPDAFVLREPVSHARLFERVDLVVHHGGAGTTATAARAGVPQLLVPHGGDQFGFARAAHLLGIAPAPFSRRRLTPRRLAAAIGEALSARPRSKARLLAAVLKTHNGVSTMVDALEALHHGPNPARLAG